MCLAGVDEVGLTVVVHEAAAADDVSVASQTLETQSQQLGSQVTQFLGKIRAA